MSHPPLSRRLVLGGGLAATTSLAAACAVSPADAQKDGAAADDAGATPVPGGTLRFGVLDAPATFDPQTASSYPESIVVGNITDKLTWQDPDSGEITPWLARSWVVSDDLTTFTFTLRDDVTFSDGTAFDSSSVKGNFDQRAFGDPDLQLTPDTAHWKGYVATTTPDPRTAVVTFDSPQAGFLQFTSFTANNAPGFLGASSLTKSKTERQDPANLVTTGPFTITEFEYQQKVVLTRREDYAWAPEALKHEGAAYLEKIEIQTVPEATVRTGALQSGDLDAILDVQPTDEIALKSAGFQIVAQAVPGTAISFFYNVQLAPTDDVNVRKALNLGWDRNSLTKAVLTDNYPVATSVIGHKVPGYVDYSDTFLRFDQAGAEDLLEQSGWVLGTDGIREKDGKKLSLNFTGISNLVVNKPAYELVQQQLAEIGVDVQLEVLPISDYSAARATAVTELHALGYNTSRDDASVLWQNFSPEVQNSSYVPDDAPYRQQVVDGLAAVNLTLDEGKRNAAAEDAQELLLDTYALALPVYEPTQVIATSAAVHGILFDAQSRNPFLNTWISGKDQ